MNDDERLKELLRAALDRHERPGPGRDLWPLIVARSRSATGWSWLDLGIAAVVALLLWMRPAWLALLAWHL
jgi:hypothetical protein